MVVMCLPVKKWIAWWLNYYCTGFSIFWGEEGSVYLVKYTSRQANVEFPRDAMYVYIYIICRE